MKTLKAGAVVLAGLMMGALMGCQLEGSMRESSGVVTYGGDSGNPVNVLNHSAKVAYYGGLEKVFKRCRSIAPSRRAFQDFYRYYSGFANLYAGQGGFVSRAKASWGDVVEGVEAMPSTDREAVSRMFAAVYEEAAGNAVHVPAAARKFRSWAGEWMDIADR